MAERSLTEFDRAHESESDPESKKQKLEQLQRKAYYSVLLASKAETSAISHKKSQIIQKLTNEWMIDNQTYVSFVDKIEKDLAPQHITSNSDENGMHIPEGKPLTKSEKKVTWSPSSVIHSVTSWGSVNPESLVGKQVHARSPDEDDLPTSKKMKLDELQKQAYDDVLHAFNAESRALSSSRTLIMQDLLDECNKAHIASSIDDDNIKTDTPLVEPLVEDFTSEKIVEPNSRYWPDGVRFRPTDFLMANFFLKKKALGLPIHSDIIPEEYPDIFSKPPRDLPGYPEETEWFCYGRKPNGQDSQNLWTRVGEDTTVFDPDKNPVAIKRRFTLTEQEEESQDIILPGEEEWFMDEISLPSTVVDTDLVFCHVILTKMEKWEEEEEEEEEKEGVEKKEDMKKRKKKKKKTKLLSSFY